MRLAVRSSLFTLALSAILAAPLMAATAYFEGWETPGDVAGWQQNTISCEVLQMPGGGNPGGYLSSFRLNGTFNAIGATTELPAASGDYAAAGVYQVSFDLRNEFADVSNVSFRVRYQDSSMNGWAISLANDLPAGTWVPFVINFDPTWTDAQAILAGWASDGPGTPDFATTMSDVYHPEIRVTTALPTGAELNGGGDQIGIDNFRILTSCAGETTPPEVDITLSRDVLWPPNHKLVEVCVEDFGITDNCDPDPMVTLVSVTSSEPDDSTGDGDTEGDIVILEDDCFLLRAERSGSGEGRKYTITYDVTDAEGNTTTAMACVTVPHDQGGHAKASSGFAPAGGFLSYMSSYVIVIPSNGSLDARTIDPERALVGNHLGIVSPTDFYRLDVNGDRREDLALVYQISPTQDLIDRTAMENQNDAGLIEASSAGSLLLVKPNAVGFRFEVDGQGRYVNDVTKLGSPVKLPPKEGEHGDGGTAEIPRDGLDLGAGLMTVSQGGRVVVEVFNIQGQKIRTILDQDVTSGTVSIAWDGRDDSGSTTPGGIYFTRIVAPGVQHTSKVFISNR